MCSMEIWGGFSPLLDVLSILRDSHSESCHIYADKHSHMSLYYWKNMAVIFPF